MYICHEWINTDLPLIERNTAMKKVEAIDKAIDDLILWCGDRIREIGSGVFNGAYEEAEGLLKVLNPKKYI